MEHNPCEKTELPSFCLGLPCEDHGCEFLKHRGLSITAQLERNSREMGHP